MSDKITATELEAKLGYKKTNFYEKADEALIKAAYDYAPGYMAYLDAGKTERLCAAETVCLAEAKGYRPFVRGMEVKPGDKVFVEVHYFEENTVKVRELWVTLLEKTQ